MAGTRISTNIVNGGAEEFETFGIIERAKIVRETREGRMQEVEVKLSDWVYSAIKHNEVLTLSRDYFRLRKPLERRMYEIARKHCGKQKEWRISLEKLQLKCGSSSTLKEFRRLVGTIVSEDTEHHHMPNYAVSIDEDDMVVFTNREILVPEFEGMEFQLRSDTYEHARTVAPSWDVYHMEREWRAWITETPRNPDAAFVGFCRKWFERRGRSN